MDTIAVLAETETIKLLKACYARLRDKLHDVAFGVWAMMPSSRCCPRHRIVEMRVLAVITKLRHKIRRERSFG